MMTDIHRGNDTPNPQRETTHGATAHDGIDTQTPALYKQLQTFGYRDVIELVDNKLIVASKGLELSHEALFFVDGCYRTTEGYTFAISAPKYNTKGILHLAKKHYRLLMRSPLGSKFNTPIETDLCNICITFQYGMRKISKEDFDPQRYRLRVGFDDFPPCPYGHTFKMLGFDTLTNEYVRLSPSILKDPRLQREFAYDKSSKIGE